MAMQQRNSVVGVFHDRASAQRAVQDLKRAGFTDDQIGVIGRDTGDGASRTTDADETDSYAAEGAATGIAAGAGIGALWGLGVLAGAIPAIGPAIAGGTLAALLSSAAAGAAAAGLAGTLIGMGVPKDEAEYYESEFRSGRILVTVSAMGREMDAREILRRHGAYDSTNPSALSSQGTMEGSTRTTHAAGHTAAAGSTSHSTSGTVRAVEEELHVRKTPLQQTGEVNVRKEVHTEHKTIDVPVTREEVVIERKAPSGQTATGGVGAGQQEIRVPVKEEQVHVEKTPVVKEEVSVSKRKVQGTERVSENLRKEEIKIENQGNADVCDTRDHKKS